MTTPSARDAPARSSPLAIYLNDHLGGAAAGLELARRIARTHQGMPAGEPLARLAVEIAEDRDALLRIMRALGVRVQRYKVVVGWVTEKAGRLKPNGRLLRRSPLSSVVELGVAADRHRGQGRRLAGAADCHRPEAAAGRGAARQAHHPCGRAGRHGGGSPAAGRRRGLHPLTRLRPMSSCCRVMVVCSRAAPWCCGLATGCRPAGTDSTAITSRPPPWLSGQLTGAPAAASARRQPTSGVPMPVTGAGRSTTARQIADPLMAGPVIGQVGLHDNGRPPATCRPPDE